MFKMFLFSVDAVDKTTDQWRHSQITISSSVVIILVFQCFSKYWRFDDVINKTLIVLNDAD